MGSESGDEPPKLLELNREKCEAFLAFRAKHKRTHHHHRGSHRWRDHAAPASPSDFLCAKERRSLGHPFQLFFPPEDD